jgi:hypothetical protein
VRDWAEDDAVRRLCLFEHGIRKRRACGTMRRPTDVGVVEGEAQAERRGSGPQNPEGRRGNFRTYTVALEHQKLQRIRHRLLSFTRDARDYNGPTSAGPPAGAGPD